MSEQEFELEPVERSAIDEANAEINAQIQQRNGMLKLIARQKGVAGSAFIDYRDGKLVARTNGTEPITEAVPA